MAKKHSSEAFYALDGPLEATLRDLLCTKIVSGFSAISSYDIYTPILKSIFETYVWMDIKSFSHSK
jgi:hypothetical protein